MEVTQNRKNASYRKRQCVTKNIHSPKCWNGTFPIPSSGRKSWDFWHHEFAVGWKTPVVAQIGVEIEPKGSNGLTGC